MVDYFEKMYKQSKQQFYQKIDTDLNDNQKTFIITANPETLMIAEKNKQLSKVLLSEKPIIVADGVGVVKAGKILNVNFKERIPGVEIVEKLLRYTNQYSKKAYFFGASEEVMISFVKMVKSEYSNIEIVGYKNGYDGDKDEVFMDILKLKPDLVIVALGIPNQELLIDKYYSQFEKGIFIGVGGSLDVLSGHKKRAPKIFIKLNIEWLYRLIKEPSRFKRFYNNNVKFIFKILKVKYQNKKR